VFETASERVGPRHHRGTAMEHFAGIDVSLKDSSVCVVDAAGRIVREAKGCTARGFWDTELKPMPRWQQFEAASDEIGLA
jgi:hypothetical protein